MTPKTFLIATAFVFAIAVAGNTPAKADEIAYTATGDSEQAPKRSSLDIGLDSRIANSIRRNFKQVDDDVLMSVAVLVWKQNVVLTGAVNDPQDRALILSLANADMAISRIHDYIQIVSEETFNRNKALYRNRSPLYDTKASLNNIDWGTVGQKHFVAGRPFSLGERYLALTRISNIQEDIVMETASGPLN